MSDQTPVANLNSEFLQAKASRLDAAISKALESKMPAAPTGGSKAPGAPGKAPSSSPPASSSAGASSTPAPAPSPESPTTQDPSPSDGVPSPEELGLDPGVPADGEPQDGAAEAPQPAVDVAALNALAKKRDLRAVEKQLGLEEGVLGATNGEYAAYRRRCEEVERLHASNNEKLIAKFGPAADLVAAAQKGDIRAYGALLERTTGIRVATFVQHYAQNVPQVSARELQLEQENARLRGAQQQPAPEPAAAPLPAAREAAIQKADTYIAAEAKGHPALKLKDGAKAVREAWLASFRNGSFGLSPKQAADAVVSERKKAHEQEQWILSGKQQPPAPRTRTVNRGRASETQVRHQNKPDPFTKEGREKLIEQGANMVRQMKAADRARSR